MGRAVSMIEELAVLARSERVRGWCSALQRRRESCQVSVFFAPTGSRISSLHLAGSGFVVVVQERTRAVRRAVDVFALEALLDADPAFEIEHVVEALVRFEDGLRPALRWAA